MVARDHPVRLDGLRFALADYESAKGDRSTAREPLVRRGLTGEGVGCEPLSPSLTG